jgi:hypothetical protein
VLSHDLVERFALDYIHLVLLEVGQYHAINEFTRFGGTGTAAGLPESNPSDGETELGGTRDIYADSLGGLTEELRAGWQCRNGS